MLGSAAIYITDNFISREIATMTTRQMDNLKDMVDVTMFELDALNLTFSVNMTMISTLDNLLGGKSLSFEEVRLSKLLNEILSAQSNARPYVDSVYFYLDKHPDRFLSLSEGIVELKTYPDADWFASYSGARKDRLLWTETREVRRFGFERAPESIFTIYRRLFPAGNGRTGVIAMNIEKEHFDGLISRAAVFRGQEVYLLDSDDNLILANQNRKERSLICKTLEKREINALSRQTWQGDSFYVYSSPTSRYGWHVVSIIPASSLEGLSIMLRRLILAMLGIALVIGVAITLSFARRNAHRTASVTELFRKAEEGEVLPDNPPLRHDEYDYMVETLIRTFLKQRYATLQLSERQARAEVLELKALRAQMNPHFLFNTLESLYWMVFGNEGKPSQAADMIKNLSMLLKYSLAESEFVSLGDEIDMAKRYLAIQLFRYKDKFEVAWEIDGRALPCQVVKFFLQPLLENSIYHGIRDAKGKGTIRIQARLDEAAGILLIGVEDDGAGMDGQKLSEIRESLGDESHPGDHIGLFNTNRHIQLVFGPEYGLGIESAPDRGTFVEVRFPLSAPSVQI